MLGAEVGDVEPLDPDRQLLEAERVRERLERVDPLLAAALAAHLVLRERQLRVALGELPQTALVAALRHPNLNRAVAPALERLLEELLRSRIAGPSTTSRGTDGAAE